MAGLETLTQNPAFSIVKTDEGVPVVPVVVPLQTIPANLAALLHDLDPDIIQAMVDAAREVRKRAGHS
ncbi:hypothetical protein N9N28_17115 [Rubripirellula amarantea]|nr:hypothetical protein [Rubripirellula amarantea]